MKKLIAILVVFAVITGAAFAQTAGGIFVNAWGQGVFSPLMIQTAPSENGEKVKDIFGKELGARSFVGVGPDWGWSRLVSAGFTVGGSSEAIGWTFGMTNHDGWSANIWAKPFNGSDAFKITIGQYTDDTLRGKVGPGGKNGDWVLPGGFGQDYIFSRLGNNLNDGCFTAIGGSGFLFTSAPVDGLFLGWNVNTDNVLHPTGENGLNRRANDAFRFSQVAVGYNIANIGLVRVMYLGGWGGKFDMSNEKHERKYERSGVKPVIDIDGATFSDVDLQASIQAAFYLDALENVKIELGYRFFIPMTIWADLDGDGGDPSEKIVKSTSGQWLAGGVNMTFGIFNLNIFAAGVFGKYTRVVNKDALDGSPFKKDKRRDGLELFVKLDPSISLDFGTIGLSIAYKFKGSDIGILTDDGGEFTKFGRDKDAPNYTHRIGVGLWYDRGLGSGNFTVGITYTTPPLQPGSDDKGKYDKMKAFGSHWIQVPITLTYAFF